MACAPSKDSDQTGHSLSAWRKLGSLAAHWTQWRLWSDLADAQADLSLRWAHIPFCWFCHEAAHMAYIQRRNSSGRYVLSIVNGFLWTWWQNPFDSVEIAGQMEGDRTVEKTPGSCPPLKMQMETTFRLVQMDVKCKQSYHFKLYHNWIQTLSSKHLPQSFKYYHQIIIGTNFLLDI